MPDPLLRVYRAAGILLYSFDKDGRMKLLLGREDRSHKKRDSSQDLTQVWLHFGGKREGNETPYSTAERELNEETGGIFKGKPLLNMLQSNSKIAWIPRGKYILFLLGIPYDEMLPQQFQRTTSQDRKDSDQSCLRWVSLEAVMHAVSQNSLIVRDERHHPLEEISLFSFFVECLQVPGMLSCLAKLQEEWRANVHQQRSL
jgi:8-oxo-dGTP pyrophosphatase MutT (NUDIX family)